jgi:hypothetical protein
LGVAATDLSHEGEVVAAASPWAQPDPEAVGVDVVGAEDVAGAVAAVKRRALTLGSLAFGPSAACVRAQADRPHLIEADHDRFLRGVLVERDHAGGFGLVVGIGAGLPGAGALKGQARLRQDPAQVRGGDLDDRLLTQVPGQPLERPARGRHPERVGTGTGHRDDPSALLVGDPAGSPAPLLRVQRGEPPLVERVDDLADVRLVGPDQRRDLRHRHRSRRRPADQRTLTLGLRRGLARQPLEPLALLGQQLPNEHRRGTHPHLQIRDASIFDIDRRFPVDRYETEH